MTRSSSPTSVEMEHLGGGSAIHSGASKIQYVQPFHSFIQDLVTSNQDFTVFSKDSKDFVDLTSVQ